MALRSSLARAGALIVGVVIVAALAAPLLATTDPIDQDLTEALKPPFWRDDGSLRHPLGTDHLGRDVYSRLIYGAQECRQHADRQRDLRAVNQARVNVAAEVVGTQRMPERAVDEPERRLERFRQILIDRIGGS